MVGALGAERGGSLMMGDGAESNSGSASSIPGGGVTSLPGGKGFVPPGPFFWAAQMAAPLSMRLVISDAADTAVSRGITVSGTSDSMGATVRLRVDASIAV